MELTPPIRRGLLLVALHGQYPEALTRVALEGLVGAAYQGDTQAWTRDVAYLHRQKLLKIVSDPLPGGRSLETWRLTEAGFAVVEGGSLDAAVEIPPPAPTRSGAPPVAAVPPPIRRGLLLLALHAQYPNALLRASLDGLVGAAWFGDTEAWARDAAYLQRQGLVLVDEAPLPGGRTLETWALTEAGFGLVEGAATDPAVQIARATGAAGRKGR